MTRLLVSSSGHLEQKLDPDKLYAAAMPREPITITLPDGRTVDGTSWETTPFQVADSLAKSLAQNAIISKVDGTTLWDLHRPLEKSCNLQILDWDSEENNYEARQVFWHSSAHVLGEACERHLEDCCLGYGPPQESGGFFYEMRLKDNRSVGTNRITLTESVY